MDVRGVAEEHAGERDLFRPGGAAHRGRPGQALRTALPQQAAGYAGVADPESAEITWAAADPVNFHGRHKGWYAAMALLVIAVIAAVWFLTKDFFVLTALIIAAGSAGFYAVHKPVEQRYALSTTMLQIGSRQYALSRFHSFSVAPEGQLTKIVLAPVGRMARYMTLYAPDEKGAEIIASLSTRLPMEAPQSDLSGAILRRLRF